MDYQEADDAILTQIEAERFGNYEVSGLGDPVGEYPPINTLTNLQQEIVNDPFTTNTERRMILENPNVDPEELLATFAIAPDGPGWADTLLELS